MDKETILRYYGTLLTHEDITLGVHAAFLAGSCEVFGSGRTREESIEILYESVRYAMSSECGGVL